MIKGESLEDRLHRCSRELVDARFRRDVLKALLKRATEEDAKDWKSALPDGIKRERARVNSLSARQSNLKRRICSLRPAHSLQ